MLLCTERLHLEAPFAQGVGLPGSEVLSDGAVDLWHAFLINPSLNPKP